VFIIAGDRIAHTEYFEVDDTDAALARFAELRPDPLRIPPNAAWRACERHRRAYKARDWAAVEARWAATLEFDDRRRAVLTKGDRDMLVASERRTFKAGARIDGTLLA